jgi:hypothetical protein
MENSSDESEEEHSDTDNSEEDIRHASVGGKSSLDSEDDPPENRRPGRDARTRAKVTLYFSYYRSC